MVIVCIIIGVIVVIGIGIFYIVNAIFDRMSIEDAEVTERNFMKVITVFSIIAFLVVLVAIKTDFGR